MSTNSNIMHNSYLILTAAAPLYQNKWLCNETLFWILKAHYPHLKMKFNVTRGGLNHALNDKAGPLTGPNEVGAKKLDTLCPYIGKKMSVCFYYRHEGDDKRPSDPVCASDIANELGKKNQLQRDCI
jgi:hypothetical protein